MAASGCRLLVVLLVGASFSLVNFEHIEIVVVYHSILNSFKIAGQTPSPLYPKGEFLMLTAAYNIKHNNVYECRYCKKALSMSLTIHIQFLRGRVNSYEHCSLHYVVIHIRTSLATQDLNATKIP